MSAVEVGAEFRYGGATVQVVAVGVSGRYGTRDGQVCIEAMTMHDAEVLGWGMCSDGTYQGISDLAEFAATSEAVTR